jgi:basic membrane protein A
MPPSFPISRRVVIRGLLAASTLGLVKLTSGCSTAKQQGSSGKGGKDLIVGFIYVGPKDDYGYNQAHAEGAAAIAKMAGVKVVEEANVPETTAVAETMRNMIEVDGAALLFPTSFGYFDPHVLKLAQEYPDDQFLHCGGLYQPGHPKNAGSYFGYIDEAQYVAGIVAAHTSKTGKLGFVAAKPIPQVLRNINSFTLGARSVRPEATTQVVFTGNWAEPVKEAEAANSLADQGMDVLTCHVDSPKIVMETAEKRGIYCSGYHTNQAALAPKGYLTGAEWDWATVYQNYVKRCASRQNSGEWRDSPPLSRRLGRRVCQGLALWPSGQRRGQKGCGFSAGTAPKRRPGDLLRRTQRQSRQDHPPPGTGAQATRYRFGKNGLAGGRSQRQHQELSHESGLIPRNRRPPGATSPAPWSGRPCAGAVWIVLCSAWY